MSHAFTYTTGPFAPNLWRGITVVAGFQKFFIVSLTAVLITSFGACGGSSEHSNPYITGMSALPNVPTQKMTSNVVLPSGSKVSPSQVTVLSMIDQAVPVGNGQFSISSSNNGSQIAVVLSPKGNPMLLGWLDANHASVSATSTAEVIVYFALAGYLLDDPANRATLIEEIPSAPGFAAVVSAISAAVAADTEVFSTNNTTVSTALTAVVAPLLAPVSATTETSPSKIHSLTPARLRQLLGIKAVVVQEGAQSYLTVQPDNPLSAHVVNNGRRRAWAYVAGATITLQDGTIEPYLDDLTNFEVSPVVGLNNGFAGGISDIINYEFGNTTAAYGPVSSPDTPFAMTLAPSSKATTYQVTIVGPGKDAVAAVQSLPSAQADKLIDIGRKGFMVDAFLPFIVNAVAGTFSATSSNLAGSKQEFYTSLATNLTTDFINFCANAPSLYNKVLSGDRVGALNDFLTSLPNSNAYQQFSEATAIAVFAGFEATGATATQGATKGLLTALSSFNRILAATGVALQAVDSTIYGATTLNSNAVERWSVTVTPTPVTINPLTSSITTTGSVVLQASLSGVTDLTPYSFLWTTTGLAGSFTGANASQNGTTSYCTSSSSTTYQADAGTLFPSGQNSLQDTVSVQVYQGTGANACTTAPLLAATSGVGDALPATIVVTKNTLTISPENPILTPGQTIPITVQTTSGNPADSPPNFQWSLQANANGTLSASGGTTILYTAGVTGPDTLSVQGTDPLSGKVVGSGTTTITVKEPSGLTFTASSGSACCGGFAPGTYTTPAVPTAVYEPFCANYACDPQQYGLVVGWGIGGALRLAIPDGTFITGPASWTMWAGILDTVVPGQFLFMCDTCDNIGNVTITTLTPLPDGTQLATFTFTEASGSPSSTRTYQGSGSFIVPAPPATSH